MKTLKPDSLINSMIFTLLFSVIIFLAVSGISGIIVWATIIPEKFLFYFLLLSLSVTSFFASLYFSSKRGQGGILNGLAVSLCIVLFFAFLSLQLSGNTVNAEMVIKLALPVATGIIGGIVGVN